MPPGSGLCQELWQPRPFCHSRNNCPACRYSSTTLTSHPSPAINDLATLYARAGQWNDAIAALRYGIDVVPGEESFYLNLASVYVSMGNRDAARQAIDRLLARNPDSLRASQALRELERR